MEIRQWVLDTYGFDGWWAAFQFDNAVMWFGGHVENAMNETETVYKNGRETVQPKYATVKDYFDDLERGVDRGAMGFIYMAKAVGALVRR